MPYPGLTPFLLLGEGDLPALDEVSVNALSRAHSISTETDDYCMLLMHNVSMPYPGLTPFLRKKTYLLLFILFCVNALSRAHSISTIGNWQKCSN